MLAQATNENALLFHERDVLVRQNSDLVGENEHLKVRERRKNRERERGGREKETK